MQLFKILLWAASLAHVSLALPVQDGTDKKRIESRDTPLTQAQVEGLRNVPCIKEGAIPGDVYTFMCAYSDNCKECLDSISKLGLPHSH